MMNAVWVLDRETKAKVGDPNAKTDLLEINAKFMREYIGGLLLNMAK